MGSRRVSRLNRHKIKASSRIFTEGGEEDGGSLFSLQKGFDF